MQTALWLLLLLASPAAAQQVSTPHASYPAAKLRGLKVASAGGGIKVRGIRTDAVVVEQKQTLGGALCKLTTQTLDGVLVVSVSEANNAPCQIDLDIALPRRLDVELRDDAGNIFVSGIESNLELTLNQGNAVLGGKIQRFKAAMKHGSLSAQGLLSDADITLGAGNAQLWFTGAPKATVCVEVDRGNVTVGSNVSAFDAQINLETGQIQSTLPQAADAPLHLKGHIAHGNLIVRAGRSP